MSGVDLGHDLRVLLGPPGLGAHDAALLDLQPRPRPSQQSRRPRSARVAPDPHAAPPAQGWASEPPGTKEVVDLEVIDGRENLAQALVLRLLTPLGSLSALGHDSYGSRLGELIGRRKTESLRGLCRAFVLEALEHEPRIDKRALAITFDPLQETAASFAAEISVRPIDGEPLTVGVEVPL